MSQSGGEVTQPVLSAHPLALLWYKQRPPLPIKRAMAAELKLHSVVVLADTRPPFSIGWLARLTIAGALHLELPAIKSCWLGIQEP